MFRYSLIVVVVLVTFISCKESDEKMSYLESTGRINHLIVVMDNDLWLGAVGDTLRSIIGEPLVGLPQEEAPFTVNLVDPKAFSNLFKRTRNVLYIDFGEKNDFYTNYNVYAAPQTIMTLLGKDAGSLIENLNSHKTEIIDIFKKQDLSLYQKKITGKHWKAKNIATMEKIGFDLKIPVTYNKVVDSGDFLWYRYTFTSGTLNLLAYEIPVSDKSEFTKENIVRIRDSVGRKNIPGQFKDTYMTTELQVPPVFTKLNFKGKEAYEARGLWYVENDYMGGPFISYSLYDDVKKRIIIAEGFSYSPSTKKRDFVFELEAILKTLEIKK